MAKRAQQRGAPKGPDEAVAQVVRAIPAGQVSSYAQVAKRAKLPAGPRGVARALSRVEGLPWWRVIRSDGTLAPEVAVDQARRLRKEGVEVKGRRVLGASALDTRPKLETPARRAQGSGTIRPKSP